MVTNHFGWFLYDFFRKGEYRSGVDRVGSPSVCKNVSSEMKLVVQVRSERISFYSSGNQSLLLAFSRFHSFAFIALVFCRDTSWLLATINRSNKSTQSYLNHDLILSRAIISSECSGETSLVYNSRFGLGRNWTREKRISEIFRWWTREDLSSDEYYFQCGKE